MLIRPTLIPALLFILGASSILTAEEPAAPMTATGAAIDVAWMTDVAAAKTLAVATGRDLLFDFTGSDWCVWCIRLKNEVFSTPGFASASSRFVLVELDFPNKFKLSDELAAQNRNLAEAWGIQSFPSIILADAMGRPYARTGYQPGGAEPYLEHLNKLQSQKIERDRHVALAAAATTAAGKAQALHAAFGAMGPDPIYAAYMDEVKAIIAADANGKLGFKSKYEEILGQSRMSALMTAVGSALEAGNSDQALALLTDAIAASDLPKITRQQLMFSKAGIMYQGKRPVGEVIALLEQGVALMPESEGAVNVTSAIPRIRQEAAALSAPVGASATNSKKP